MARMESAVHPVLVPGCVYLRADIIEALHVSPWTIAKWKAAGLKIRQPGTKLGFIFADDLIDVFRKLTD